MERKSHLYLKANKKGRDFFVGDLHGMYKPLKKALKKRDFDTKKDRLISVGDLVDRGPDSMKLLSLLEEDWFYAVRGNHEEMLLELEPVGRVFHQRNGGEWTLDVDADTLTYCRHLAYHMPDAITVEGAEGHIIGVCHAEWPGRDWADVEKTLTKKGQRRQMIWGRKRIKAGKNQKDKTADLLIHGHTPLDRVKRLGVALFIDTGLVYGGSLTLLTAEEALDF